MTLTLEKPLVLVGLMGAGKTTIGYRLAQKLDVPFVDSDQEVEAKTGCSVSEIFETMGEQTFRELERETIAELLEHKPKSVIATGGGAFMNKQTRRLIKEKALSIWLRADLDVLVERVSRKESRPLLEKGDKRAILEKLIQDRYPIYEEADLIVDSSVGPHYKVVDEVIWKL